MSNLDSYNYRFNGIEKLYGVGSLERIKNLHIAIIGIGGVGSWAAESLVRSGVGEITLVDFDDICFSNINRQSHALTSTVGQMKTDAMKMRLKDINPNCEVHCIERLYTEKSANEILSHSFDYIIDAFDDSKRKVHLIMECRKRNQKLIVTGGAASRVKAELVQISDLTKSFQDPLLFKIRKDFRQKHNLIKLTNEGVYQEIGIPCVFSSEKSTLPGEYDQQESQTNCNGNGSISFVTASFANIAVSHVLNDLLQR